MTINYGKRNPGLLTAASPGDTLYIPLNFYNDSGASISIGASLAVADIEVFKNGSVAQRATDSGYAVLGDTGNFDNRVGFKGISISLFNTADDASFYAAGSSYWVAIDSVNVDGRTVRFFPAVFEIGEQRANIVQINGDTGAASQLQQAFATTPTYFQQVDVQQMDGDTGAADVLQKFADTTGALNPSGELDTGSVANASYLPANAIRLGGDTGALGWLRQTFASGFADTGLNDRLARILADTDTGIQSGVNVTSFADTGVNNRLSVIAADTDTGIQSSVNVTAFADTGVNDRLAKILADTDTGIQSGVAVTSFSDTGVNGRLAAIQTKTDSLTFTVAGQVDSNIQRVNDVLVSGTGASGDEWGPA